MKLIRLVQMCLNGSCIKVWVQVNIFPACSGLMMLYYHFLSNTLESSDSSLMIYLAQVWHLPHLWTEGLNKTGSCRMGWHPTLPGLSWIFFFLWGIWKPLYYIQISTSGQLWTFMAAMQLWFKPTCTFLFEFPGEGGHHKSVTKHNET
jgi:hypothetical protein